MLRFFTLDGRSPPLRLLLWMAATLLSGMFCTYAFRTGAALYMVPAGALLGLVTAKLVAELARRRHDMGRSAGAALVLAGAVGVTLLAGVPVLLLTGSPMLLLAGAIAVPVGGLALLRSPGTIGGNRYGAAPRGPCASTLPGRPAAMGMMLALLLIVGGGLAGGGAAAWSAAVRERHRHDREYMQRLQTQPAAGPDALELEYGRGNRS